MRRVTRTAAGVAVAIAAVAVAMPAGADPVTPNWQTFGYSAEHTSWNRYATAITASNAGSLQAHWTWTPPTITGRPAPALYASPDVVNGVVYIGTDSGYLYALSESTGAVEWSRDLGVETTNCSPGTVEGMRTQPSVYPDPVSGANTIYVTTSTDPGTVTMDALNASDGSVNWSTVIGSQSGLYATGSPMVGNGNIYQGLSSACGAPDVTGAVVELSQTTGAVENTYNTEPSGTVGADVATTPTNDPETTQEVWVTTGDGPSGVGDADSILGFSQSLGKTDGYRIGTPFESSPVLMRGSPGGGKTVMVGACAADGYYYAFNRTDLAAGPLWRTQIDTTTGTCQAGATFDNAAVRLFVAGAQTTIGGTTSPGGIRMINTSTGNPTWQTPLNQPTVAAASLNASNLLAVGGDSGSGAGSVSLVNALNGNVVTVISTGSGVASQPVFADNNLFVATTASGLIDFQPGGSTGVAPVITSANCSGLNCSFDGSGSSSINGSITDYSWDFGDGTSTDAGSSPATTHAYASGGSYTVTLTVTDSTGAKASIGTTVSPVAAAGTGTLTVSPTSVSAGSSGHSFSFTYTSPQTSSAAHVLLDIQVPAGWTAPQHTSSTQPGYVRVHLVGCTRGGIVSVTGSGPWTVQAKASCPSQTVFRVSYGGGGTKVTAPSSPGSYTFTSSVEVSPATTFTPFASQPTVTVH